MKDRIRAIYWKQWKKVKTRYRNPRALKLEEWQVHQIVTSRRGYWRTAQILGVTSRYAAEFRYGKEQEKMVYFFFRKGNTYKVTGR